MTDDDVDDDLAVELADGFHGDPGDSDDVVGFFDETVFSPKSFEAVTDAGSPDDGRTQRRSRNRDAVIGALLQLIREGDFEPSVAEIAERAGVSHRSVFRYFDDLGDLVRAAIEREVRDAIPLGVIENPGQGTLEHRVEAFVDARLRTYAHTNMVGRFARLRAATLPAIEDGLKSISLLRRVQLRMQFEQELAGLDEDAAMLMIDSILVVVSFEAHDMLLRTFDHTNDEIRAVWCNAMLKLLR